MRDIAPTIARWAREDRRFALARVMSTWGSSPRGVGSAMAVSEDLKIAGSVSGGCIEGEVIDAATEVIASGEARVLDFGISNDTAWSVGLSCGGRVSVLVERFPAFAEDAGAARLGSAILSALVESRPFTWLTTVPPAATRHLVVPPEGDSHGDPTPFGPDAAEVARRAYQRRFTGLSDSSDPEYFIHSVPPRSRLLIIGATDIATHLVRLATGLDFETVVVDPREAFAAEDRFSPAPCKIIASWPQDVLPDLVVDDETYAVLLTHDPKIDDPALHLLLESPAAYIGALGSRRTHAKRLDRLEEAGFDRDALGLINGPVGLDIGATSPAEIALSIIAQVIGKRNRTVTA